MVIISGDDLDKGTFSRFVCLQFAVIDQRELGPLRHVYFSSTIPDTHHLHPGDLHFINSDSNASQTSSELGPLLLTGLLRLQKLILYYIIQKLI